MSNVNSKDSNKVEKTYPKGLMEAYKVILDYCRGNTSDPYLLDNFKGSEDRCVRALLETCKSEDEIIEKINHIISKSFPVNRDSIVECKGGLITQGPITIDSSCPHHLYPVRYSAFVSYIPDGDTVLGLSKLARICKIMGRRPVLHEQLASDIADVLCWSETSRFPGIKSYGSAVMLVGVHSCEFARGVHEDALTSVVELRGGYWDPDMEEKFYRAVESIKSCRPFANI